MYVDIIDAKKLRRRTGPFYIAEGKAQPARKLTTEFAESHRDLLPLFRQIAWLIGASLHVVVTNTYGYFSLADRHRNGREKVGVINSFKINTADSSSVDLSDILDTCLQIIRDLQRYDAFQRYLAELRATSYYNARASRGLLPHCWILSGARGGMS